MGTVHKEGDPECSRRDRFQEMVRKRETIKEGTRRDGTVHTVAEWSLATRALCVTASHLPLGHCVSQPVTCH